MELELKDFKEDEILYLKSCVLFKNSGEDKHDTLNYIMNLSAHLKAANNIFQFINCDRSSLIQKIDKFERIFSFNKRLNVGERLHITVKSLLEYINLYKDVSSLKDLDGLNNGLGLIIKVDTLCQQNYNINIYNTDNSNWYIKHYEDISSWEEQVIINDLKAFGFLFDIKKED